jgi:methylenetetrahydrofolate dehydrogenase (NAD+)
VDIDSLQEYTKRPAEPSPTETATANGTDKDKDGGAQKKKRVFHPTHVVQASKKTLEECLALSDVVISAVPNVNYKVSTDALKYGCIAVNVAGEKNFEESVREKVR